MSMMARASVAAAERRVHERNDFSGTLLLQWARQNTWITVHGRDVSAGGFSFFSEWEMGRGDAVIVSVPDVAHAFPAVVRHVKREKHGWVIGVEFDDSMPDPIERCLRGA
jgi:hypothetical protein